MDKGTKKNWNMATDTVQGDLELTANWEAKTYAVTFHGNNGKDDTTTDVTYSDDAKVDSKVVTKSNYTFAGWHLRSDLVDKPFDFDKTLISDELLTKAEPNEDGKYQIDLYAAWTPNTYKVKFESNGGTKVSGQAIVFAEENGKPSAKVSKPTDPTRKHYEFDGWYTDSGFAEKTDFNFDTAIVDTMTTAVKDEATGETERTLTLYAKWKPVEYKATFNPNGGVSASYTDDENKVVIVNTSTAEFKEENGNPTAVFTCLEEKYNPTRTGYAFTGWFIDEACLQKYDFNTPVAGNITLYAGWTPNPVGLDYKNLEAVIALSKDFQGQLTVFNDGASKDGFRKALADAQYARRTAVTQDDVDAATDKLHEALLDLRRNPQSNRIPD